MPRASAVLALTVALAACSSVKVSSEWDKNAKFKSYKTYGWIQQAPGPDEAPAARDPRLREAVIQGVDQGLASKGLTKAAPDQTPDLLVAVHGWAINKIDVSAYGYAYGPVTYGPHPMLANPGGLDVRQYREGTLLIDLVDTTTKLLVWRGTATDTFDPGAEAKTVTRAIEKTLDQYPPETTN